MTTALFSLVSSRYFSCTDSSTALSPFRIPGTPAHAGREITEW